MSKSIVRVTIQRLACLTIMAASFACATDPVKAPPGGRVDLLPIEDYPQIVATGNLHYWLAFSPPKVTPATDAQPLHVTVPVRSLYDQKGLNLQYRFIFFDKDMRPLHADPAYVFLNARPRLQYELAGNALDDRAVDWRLEVRPAR